MPQTLGSKQYVIDSLSHYDKRIDRLMSVLSEGRQMDMKLATELYSAIKADLRSDHKSLEARRRSGETTAVEDAYLIPALHEALVHLHPATNTNPHNSDWYSAVYDAHIDISHVLFQLQSPQDA